MGNVNALENDRGRTLGKHVNAVQGASDHPHS